MVLLGEPSRRKSVLGLPPSAQLVALYRLAIYHSSPRSISISALTPSNIAFRVPYRTEKYGELSSPLVERATKLPCSATSKQTSRDQEKRETDTWSVR